MADLTEVLQSPPVKLGCEILGVPSFLLEYRPDAYDAHRDAWNDFGKKLGGHASGAQTTLNAMTKENQSAGVSAATLKLTSADGPQQKASDLAAHGHKVAQAVDQHKQLWEGMLWGVATVAAGVAVLAATGVWSLPSLTEARLAVNRFIGRAGAAIKKLYEDLFEKIMRRPTKSVFEQRATAARLSEAQRKVERLTEYAKYHDGTARRLIGDAESTLARIKPSVRDAKAQIPRDKWSSNLQTDPHVDYSLRQKLAAQSELIEKHLRGLQNTPIRDHAGDLSGVVPGAPRHIELINTYVREGRSMRQETPHLDTSGLAKVGDGVEGLHNRLRTVHEGLRGAYVDIVGHPPVLL